jgi:DNA invertase Pin-like site-specific DNA recombinase
MKGHPMALISKTELIKMQKQLGTDEAIGKKFKVTRQAIHQLRKKYGIDSRLADNPERNDKVVSAYKKGASGTDIAKKFELSVSQTYRIINEAGALKKTAKKAVKKGKKK